MRAVALLVPACLLFAGCGYVGDPMPPALNIPSPVLDLTVRQVGPELIFAFTIPDLTTDGLPLRRVEAVDLRVGPPVDPFDADRWEENTEEIPVPARASGRVEVRIPVSRFSGRELVAAVRLEGPTARFSDWSAPVPFKAVPPLETPSGLLGRSHPSGVHVVWNAVAQPGLEWQVYRASEGQEEFEPVARVGKPEYIDTTAAYGKTYRYRVEAVSGNAVSLPSQTVSVLPEDRFPPAIPTGLVGLAGLNTIELTWDRNTEEDLRGYRVYRAGKTGEFMAVSDIIETPAFSDRALESGMTYRYRVAAIDQKMNESKPSEPLEVSAP